MNEEKKGVPPWAYMLGGVAVGAALGVLFAPKKGSELRGDIRDWTKERSEQGKAFLARVKKEAPAALEHAKDRAQEAIAAVKERTHLTKV
jgi:gas vesicle protein